MSQEFGPGFGQLPDMPPHFQEGEQPGMEYQEQAPIPPTQEPLPIPPPQSLLQEGRTPIWSAALWTVPPVSAKKLVLVTFCLCAVLFAGCSGLARGFALGLYTIEHQAQHQSCP